MLLELRQKEILRLIWRESRLSRWELHERTGVNPNAIGSEAAALLQLGILKEGSPESVGQGRPRIPLEIDMATRHVLGLSFGQGQVELARLNLRGQMLGKSQVQATDLPQEALQTAARLLRQTVKDQTLAIGISSRGFLDQANKSILFSALNRTPHPLNLEGIFTAAAGKPIVFENDMHALAVRWLLTHLAEEREDVLLVYAGDGRLGAAMLIDGRPNRGCLSGANELGHTRLPVETEPCYCGHIGCLERICSSAFLTANQPASGANGQAAHNKEWESANETTSQSALFDRAAQYSPTDERMRQMLRLLAMGIANAVNFMRPNRLVLVSELTRYAAFSDELMREIRANLLYQLVNHIRIDAWDQPGAVSAESAGWLALAGLYQAGWNPL
ncbi:MAG: ROK family protein [Pirellulales bacterium]|nr:ROK family protein [Pirellulales bacterium]